MLDKLPNDVYIFSRNQRWLAGKLLLLVQKMIDLLWWFEDLSIAMFDTHRLWFVQFWKPCWVWVCPTLDAHCFELAGLVLAPCRSPRFLRSSLVPAVLQRTQWLPGCVWKSDMPICPWNFSTVGNSRDESSNLQGFPQKLSDPSTLRHSDLH